MKIKCLKFNFGTQVYDFFLFTNHCQMNLMLLKSFLIHNKKKAKNCFNQELHAAICSNTHIAITTTVYWS